MMTLRSFYLLSLWCSTFVLPCLADTYTFSESAPGFVAPVPHEVIASQISLRVQHPFRVVTAQSEQLSGAMLIDFQDLTRGARCEFSLAASSFLASNPKISVRMQKVLKAATFPKMVFTSSKVTVLPGSSPDHFPLELEGELTITDVKLPMRLPMDCRVEGGAEVCQTYGTIKPTDYGLGLPKLMGLVTEDRVDFSGTVTLRAQR